eukprot:4174931-Alexandrium_andersonii.AAC.1
MVRQSAVAHVPLPRLLDPNMARSRQAKVTQALAPPGGHWLARAVVADRRPRPAEQLEIETWIEIGTGSGNHNPRSGGLQHCMGTR